MTHEELLELIAKVMGWVEGLDPADIADFVRETNVQDYAQQCAEDLGLAP